MKKKPSLVLILFLSALLTAQEKPSAGSSTGHEAALTALLHEFLAGAPSGKPEVYDRFFADDLIYTSSAGSTIHKADIMKGLEPPKAGDPVVTYDGDDITVHEYGKIAVVNFRLIQHIENMDGTSETNYFRNTGTFLNTNGRWQVVAWQATRVPQKEKSK